MATSKLTLWHKAGRFITGLVVVCFFLPFFGVECKGMDVVHVSGADLVYGGKPGGMLTEESEGRGSAEIKVEKVDVEPLAIVALVLALASFGLAWVRTRQALLGSFVVAILGIASLGALYFKVTGDMKDEINKSTKSERVLKEGDVEAGGRMGLWGAILGLLGTAAITGMALKEKEGAVASSMSPPAGPPPGV